MISIFPQSKRKVDIATYISQTYAAIKNTSSTS